MRLKAIIYDALIIGLALAASVWGYTAAGWVLPFCVALYCVVTITGGMLLCLIDRPFVMASLKSTFVPGTPEYVGHKHQIIFHTAAIGTVILVCLTASSTSVPRLQAVLYGTAFRQALDLLLFIALRSEPVPES